MASNKIRPAMVAGMFYPQKKITLEREVALVLENAPGDIIEGNVIAIAVPHAGYMYSGGVAARAYRQIIDKEFDTVVVISPSHKEYFKEVSIYDGYGYSTPLGVIPIDKEISAKLADYDPKIIISEKGHRFDEHALEVQLPFLQKVLDEFKLVPIVMGEQDQANIEILADALGTVLKGQKAFIVASSDLSHFYSYNKASIMDKVVTENVKNFDEDKLFKDVQAGRCEMCGAGPVVATMKASKKLGADKSKLLLYRNSGDVTGDRNEVVGYMSAIFYS
jgi:AmmeMemoRadiSam system protein B